jgi:hypothetical protein
MSKYYWIFGAIAGVFSVTMEYLLFSGYLGFDKSPGVLMAKLGALLICIVFASILIKKMNGGISLIRTTFGGLLMALICSTISITGYTVMTYATPNFFDGAKAYNMEQWEQNNADKPEVLAKRTEKLAEVDKSYGLQIYAAFTLVGYLLSGLMVSIFTAAFISNKSSLAS